MMKISISFSFSCQYHDEPKNVVLLENPRSKLQLGMSELDTNAEGGRKEESELNTRELMN